MSRSQEKPLAQYVIEAAQCKAAIDQRRCIEQIRLLENLKQRPDLAEIETQSESLQRK